ncbi:hypothetical protein C2S52_012832 [Perilla frutescens var. hirtella]|nr:hypothetical protein C2S52_012832 [Perilla frutescens var. hirtella]
MVALNWSLITLTALLSLAISSAHRVMPPQIIAGPIIVHSGPSPSGLSPPGPSPSGPSPSGPSPSGPSPSGPSPSEPAPPMPTSEYGPVPVPDELITSEPAKVWLVPAGPIISEPGKISPVPPGPVPVPSIDDEISAQSPADSPLPSMNGDVADNEIGTNCCGGSGWGCGGGGGNACPGYGCGGCPPAVPKNPYYCQPAANCVGSPGYGSGAGFTIYLDDHFPSSSSSDDEQH